MNFGTRRVMAATTSEALPTPTGAALLCRPYQPKPEGGFAHKGRKKRWHDFDTMVTVVG